MYLMKAGDSLVVSKSQQLLVANLDSVDVTRENTTTQLLKVDSQDLSPGSHTCTTITLTKLFSTLLLFN